MASSGEASPAPRLPSLRDLVELGLAVLATALVCIASAHRTAGLSAFWLPNGLTVAALASRPLSQWPALLIVGCTAMSVADTIGGMRPAVNGVLAVCNALEIGLAAGILQRLRGKRDLDLARAPDLVAFLVPCCLMVPAVVAAAGSAVLQGLTGEPALQIFSTWYFGDVVGILIVAPLAFVRWDEYRQRVGARRLEAAACLGVACAVTCASTYLDMGPWTFIAIPVIVLGACRLGFPMGVLGSCAATLAGLAGVMLGGGRGVTLLSAVEQLQAFAVISVFTALPVGALFQALEASRTALDEQAKRYDDLTSTAPVGLYTVVVPLEGPRYFEYVSPEFCRLLDVDAAAARTDNQVVYQAIQEDDRDRLVGHITEAMRTFQPVVWEGRITVRGDERRFRIDSRPTLLPNGASRWSSTLIDVTEQFEARRRVADALAYIDQLLEASPLAVLTFRADGSPVSANGQAARLVGTSVDQLLGHNFRDIASWKDNGMLGAAELALQTGESQALECVVSTGFGKSFWASVRYVPFEYEGARHLMLVAEDISSRKQAEEDLRASAHTQSVLLREVNHRVSNNLSTILAILHLEENRCHAHGQAETAAVLGEIDARIQSLAMVHSLLSSSSWGPLPLGDLCRLVASHAMLSSDLTVSECDPLVEVDARQAHALALVLSELATNVLKYGHAEGQRPQVEIDVRRDAEGVVLAYRDHGPGFPATLIASPSRGSSLGLDLVRGLMRQLKGRVELGNGDGAKVVLHFPEMPPRPDA